MPLRVKNAIKAALSVCSSLCCHSNSPGFHNVPFARAFCFNSSDERPMSSVAQFHQIPQRPQLMTLHIPVASATRQCGELRVRQGRESECRCDRRICTLLFDIQVRACRARLETARVHHLLQLGIERRWYLGHKRYSLAYLQVQWEKESDIECGE